MHSVIGTFSPGAFCLWSCESHPVEEGGCGLEYSPSHGGDFMEIWVLNPSFSVHYEV